MKEMPPTVGLQFTIASSLCADEITSLKLIADTATLLADAGTKLIDLPVTVEDEGKNSGDSVVPTSPASDDDDPLPVGPQPSLGSSSSAVNSSSSSSIASEVDVGDSSDSGVKAVSSVKPVIQGGSDGPLWGYTSVCGWRPEMEDAVAAVPRFFELPRRMLNGNGGDLSSIRSPAHFFGVYDGHGGSQVANYCRDRIHTALVEEMRGLRDDLGGNCGTDWQKQWERAFVDCFQKVDDEVGGKFSKLIGGTDADSCGDGSSYSPSASVDPVAPETVGSTAVVAVICSSHITIANCGDSRAVLCRGKQSVPLSVDHKPNREDEYARIEAEGGKVIQWNGHRVFGVLAMSRSIGDRYLKPWIIPVPEVTVFSRTREDECLILASDGLWDVMTNEEACEAARRRILVWHKKNGVALPSAHRGEEADPAAQAAADYLLKLALQKGSRDNITVIVVDLKAQRKFKSRP